MPGAEVDPVLFRRLMGRWATGVTVVTAHDGAEDGGLTVNAFLSVSLDPPLVLISVTRDIDTLPLIERSGHFAVNLLSVHQRLLSERFAQPVASAEKFRGLPVRRGKTGAALLEGTLGSFECRIATTYDHSDHRLVIGTVVAETVGEDQPPLLFYHSGYGDLDPEGRLRLPAARAPSERRQP